MTRPGLFPHLVSSFARILANAGVDVSYTNYISVPLRPKYAFRRTVMLEEQVRKYCQPLLVLHPFSKRSVAVLHFQSALLHSPVLKDP